MLFRKRSIEKRKIFDFNHIHRNIILDDLEQYKSYYKIYHKKRYIYRKMYKMFKRRQLIMNISSSIIGTSVIGTAIATNVIYIVGISIIPIIMQIYARYRDYEIKYRACSYVHSKCDNILLEIRSHLREGNLDLNDILYLIHSCDDMISDLCPPSIRKYERQYETTYE